jgi:hypothetical protein
MSTFGLGRCYHHTKAIALDGGWSGLSIDERVFVGVTRPPSEQMLGIAPTDTLSAWLFRLDREERDFAARFTGPLEFIR